MRSIIMDRFLPFFLSNPLEVINLKTEGGFYEGSIRLPALDPGSYNITVKDGDKILSNSYFRVENYIKPQYKLEITTDKKAVFVDEEITLRVKASFFEGTLSPFLLTIIFTHMAITSGQGVTDKRILKSVHSQISGGNAGRSYGGISVSARSLRPERRILY